MGKANWFGWLVYYSMILPRLTLLKEFLHTWEPTKDGHIKAIVCGEKITKDQMLIVHQFGINVKGVVDVANTLVFPGMQKSVME